MLLTGRTIRGGLVWLTFPYRAVITPENAHIPKRLKKYMRLDEFEITVDEHFEAVMRACQREDWTWINEAAIDIYTRLFSMGFGWSIEAHKDGQLVGGLWGFKVGRTLAPMSMFHRVDRAGAVLFGTLVKRVKDREWDVMDCGVQRRHLKRFGAQEITREEFVERVARGLNPTSSSGSGALTVASVGAGHGDLGL
jgi:leucyl/phenylalanyl-tRNA--protein transferase